MAIAVTSCVQVPAMIRKNMVRTHTRGPPIWINREERTTISSNKDIGAGAVRLLGGKGPFSVVWAWGRIQDKKQCDIEVAENCVSLLANIEQQCSIWKHGHFSLQKLTTNYAPCFLAVQASLPWWLRCRPLVEWPTRRCILSQLYTLFLPFSWVPYSCFKEEIVLYDFLFLFFMLWDLWRTDAPVRRKEAGLIFGLPVQILENAIFWCIIILISHRVLSTILPN